MAGIGNIIGRTAYSCIFRHLRNADVAETFYAAAMHIQSIALIVLPHLRMPGDERAVLKLVIIAVIAKDYRAVGGVGEFDCSESFAVACCFIIEYSIGSQLLAAFRTGQIKERK